MQLADQIRQMPDSFRNALIFLVVGWGSLLLTVQLLFWDYNLTVKLFVSAGIICFSVFQRRKWAKWLALFCNAMVILYGSFYAYLFLHGNMPMAAFVLAIDILLLAIASYYLLQKPAGDYFISPPKTENPLVHGPEKESDNKKK